MLPKIQFLCICWALLETAQPTKQTPNPALTKVQKNKIPNLWVTPTTQPRSACQQKKREFWRWHLINFLHLCQKLSSCLLTRLKWSQKTLSGSRRKSTSEELSLQDPKGYHILERACVNSPTPVSIGKKGCCVCFHCLLRESRMPHILQLLSWLVCLFIYLGPAKGFFLDLSSLSWWGKWNKHQIWGCTWTWTGDAPGLGVASRALLFPGISAPSSSSLGLREVGRFFLGKPRSKFVPPSGQPQEELCAVVGKAVIKFQQLLHQEFCQAASSTVWSSYWS